MDHPSRPTAIEVQHNHPSRPGIGEICRAPIEAHVDDETSGKGHGIEIIDATRRVVPRFDTRIFGRSKSLGEPTPGARESTSHTSPSGLMRKEFRRTRRDAALVCGMPSHSTPGWET